MIPEEIERLMPLEFGDVKIIETDGRYNVYMNVSQWTKPSRGRSQRITGICVGYITAEDGFVPNEEGKRYLASKKTAVVKTMGGYELLRQLSPGIDDKVRKAFPSMWQEIICMSLIEALYLCPSHHIYQDLYERSVLSEWYPELDLSLDALYRMEDRLGHDRKGMLAYMNAWLKQTETKKTENLLAVAKQVRDYCADGEKYEDALEDMAQDEDFGRLLTDFVKEQYLFMLDCA
ncbi:MAG: hypothetical protein LUE27_10200 [Clostridia bacterium]|nr:hypothetical protein [Clostridia bacterium]